MRRAWTTVLLLAAAAASDGQSLPATTAGAAARPGVTAGPGIGTRIPEFEARDQDGQPQTFGSVRGPKGAVIYFHRSADWCIYCKMQLLELEASRAALSRNGLGLIAISFDEPQALKAFAVERSLGFPLLSDPGSQIIRLFGLLDPAVAPDSPAYGVPVHGSLLVDEAGIVRARFFDAGTSHAAGVTLTRLFTSSDNTHEKIVRHDHVRLRYSASVLRALPGQQFELSLEIAPVEGVLLYADDAGATRTALSWEMESSPAFASGAVKYPSAVEMPVSGKLVRMYREPVRVRRSIGITREAGALSAAMDASGDVLMNGTLHFQACRAGQCYSARSIPLRWKVQGPVPPLPGSTSSGRTEAQTPALLAREGL